ncbi:MAG: hypothetical protein BAJALOKI3v1_590001 [Promethearchaeota archaeon]|jgi:hypothetical protein|nr:MAG: hypothetical protein BAJALOKI3v1_590001 [Candidatus Lokiarchaeota archaeon]
MKLKDNLEYWKISLNNLEPIADEYYFSDEFIVDDEDLIQKIERLRELIITYCVLIEKEKTTIKEKFDNSIELIFQEISYLINNIEKIQYNEFVAFWKVLDVSYSVFNKLHTKEDVLREILSNYCEKRRKQYDKLGYSNITVQAMYDNGASRRKGGTANTKLIDLINEYLDNPPHARTLDALELNSITYCLPDSRDKSLFEEFKRKNGIEYIYGKRNQGKIFDILLKVDNHYFFIEAKHMKEGGGAQNKQVAEIIDFIRYSENNEKIHYVTFMDGVYFNRFSKEIIDGTKTHKQKLDIEKYLRLNKSNYFINTAGLIEILEDLRMI